MIRKTKKAQSGMEYLITYGWAVLIVGIVLLLLMSLKVLDINWTVQNDVWMLSSFTIPDFKATPYDVNDMQQGSVLIFQLINNRGSNVTIWNITVSSPSGEDIGLGHPPATRGGLRVYYCDPMDPSNCSEYATQFPFNMTAGQRMIVNGSVWVPGETNAVFTAKLQINYTTPRSEEQIPIRYHYDTGMIRGRIEPPY
jgi:hypothetical protein